MSDTVALVRADIASDITNQTAEESITPTIVGGLLDRIAVLVDERLLSGGDTRAATVQAGTKDANNFGIITNNLRRMTVTSAGRILIKTTTESTFDFDVNGTGRFVGDLTASGKVIVNANFAIEPDTSIYLSIGNNQGGGGYYIRTLFNTYKQNIIGQNGWLISDALTTHTFSNKAASAVLHVKSTTRGFLLEPMTGVQAEAISSPADGLIVNVNKGNGAVITSEGLWRYRLGITTWEKL